MVTLESLVTAEHLLRKVDAAIDFRFIRGLTEGLCCPDNGGAPVPPDILFEALFIGYLFGIRSERQPMREIEGNVANRWFLGLRVTGRVFDVSAFSPSRRRRFDGTEVAQQLFERIVQEALAAGLVGGEVLHTDSARLEASANKGRYDKEMVARSRAAYWDDLDRAVEADHAAHGKKPLPRKDRQPDVKETKVNRGRTQAARCATASPRGPFASVTARWTGGRTGTMLTSRRSARRGANASNAGPSSGSGARPGSVPMPARSETIDGAFRDRAGPSPRLLPGPVSNVGRSFRPRRKDKLYCSRRCGNIHRNKRWRDKG